MKAGFRGWLFRFVSGLSGLFGLAVFVTLLEVSRFYGFPGLMQPAVIGVLVSFLLFVSSLLGDWTWKRFSILLLATGGLMSLVYVALRPEIVRDDVLQQLRTPALSADLLIYRGVILKDDPNRDTKIERLNFLYGFLRSSGKLSDESGRAPIPEAQ
jgi:hypothetical protein